MSDDDGLRYDSRLCPCSLSRSGVATQHGSPRHWAFPLIFVYDRLVRRETGSDQLVVDRAIDATSLESVNTPGQQKSPYSPWADGDSRAGLKQVVGAEELREGQGTDMEDTGFIDNGMIDSVPVVRILDLVKSIMAQFGVAEVF